MKKHTIHTLIGGLLCITIFSACDPSAFLDDILGEMTLTVVEGSNENNPYNVGDTIKFKSSVVDNTDLITGNNISNIFLSANIELANADIIMAPYCGFQLKDTIAKIYPMTMSLEIEDFVDLTPDSLLVSVNDDNLLIMPINDTSWYIGYDGAITVNSYPEYGHLAEGTLDSVKTYYATHHDIEYISDLVNRSNNLDPEAMLELHSLTCDSIFPTVIFNGTFASRRANIVTIIQSLMDKYIH